MHYTTWSLPYRPTAGTILCDTRDSMTVFFFQLESVSYFRSFIDMFDDITLKESTSCISERNTCSAVNLPQGSVKENRSVRSGRALGIYYVISLHMSFSRISATTSSSVISVMNLSVMCFDGFTTVPILIPLNHPCVYLVTTDGFKFILIKQIYKKVRKLRLLKAFCCIVNPFLNRSKLVPGVKSL